MLDIFRFGCFHSFEQVYPSIDSSEMMGDSPEGSLQLQPVVLSNSTGSPVTNRRFFLDIGRDLPGFPFNNLRYILL